MYSRSIEDRELRFEASGALWNASLVMRDKETDSWWSIMTSDAIGGDLEGIELTELPIGEKTTWGEWRRRYPTTVVLSVDGVEHDEVDHYANYFSSDETFRNLVVDDRRLPPKEPVYTFHWGGASYAVPHTSFVGGALFELEGEPRALFLYRPEGASMFASSVAVWLEEDEARTVEDLREVLGKGLAIAGSTSLEGFDTFWYSWIGINRGSQLLR